MLIDDRINTNREELIKDISNALEKNDFKECEILLSRLQTVTEIEPKYLSWYNYLQGILIFKRDPDYAQSEVIWSNLRSQLLEPLLDAKVLLALGNFYQRQGDWLQAIETYQECLPLFGQLDQLQDKATALRNIGNACGRGFDNGDLDQDYIHTGIQACQEAIKFLPKSLNFSRKFCGPLYNTLGMLHRNLNDWQQAGNYFRLCLTISQELNNRLNVGFVNGNLGEVYQKQGQLTLALDAYQTALGIFQELDEIREIPEVLANLAALYEEMNQREKALFYHEETIVAVEELRAQLSSQESRMAYMAIAHRYYANVILYCLYTGDDAQAFHYAERARAREYLDMLDIVHSADAGIALPMTLAQVQKNLSADGLLLSYFTTGLYCHKLYRETQKKNVRRHRFPESKILLFVVTQTTLEVYEPTIPPAKLDGVDSGSRRIWKNLQDASYRTYLYDQLIGPIAHQLHAQKALYIIPHGLLHSLPFLALLPDAATIPPLAYGLSATILLRERYQRPPVDHPFLALGYNDTGKNQLILAEQEAQRIATLMNGHSWQGSKKTDLLMAVNDYERLHFACHCEFQPATPLESILILGPEETLSAFEVHEKFRLKNCKMVVLSACDSGRHQMLRGDELLGFIRAFLHAGAQDVIATLWQVDDCSTSILMERFYQEILSGHTPSSALLHAQHYLRQLTCVQVCSILQKWSEDFDESEAAAQINKLKDKFEQQFTASELIFAAPYHWASFVLFQSDHSASA